jgi:hypothetical protein
MAFGQSLGPPATGKQVRELLELLEAAGHCDFRDARGPMGFTQRQAAGKFTRDEADGFIAELEAAGSVDETQSAPEAPASRPEPVAPRRAAAAIDLSAVSTDALAAELQGRGWIVVAPD